MAEIVCKCRTFNLDNCRALIDGCGFLHTINRCPDEKWLEDGHLVMGRQPLEGEIKEGDKLIWEPNDPKSREHVTVVRVNRHDETHASILTKGPRGEFWNDEDRVREACVRDTSPTPD